MILKYRYLIFTLSLSLLTVNFTAAKPIKDDSHHSMPPLVRFDGYRMPHTEASPPRLQYRPRHLRRFTHGPLSNPDQRSVSTHQLPSSHAVERVQNSRISNHHRPQISSQLATIVENIRQSQRQRSIARPSSLEYLLDPTSLPIDVPTVPVSPDSPSTSPLSRDLSSSSKNFFPLNR